MIVRTDAVYSGISRARRRTRWTEKKTQIDSLFDKRRFVCKLVSYREKLVQQAAINSEHAVDLGERLAGERTKTNCLLKLITCRWFATTTEREDRCY